MPNLGQMDMIQTLEYSGLILEVGRWVMEQAICECAKWNRAGSKSLVHVNIAAQQVSDVGLVTFIKEKCNEKNQNKEQNCGDKQPPLCKGRWHAERDGGIVKC